MIARRTPSNDGLIKSRTVRHVSFNPGYFVEEQVAHTLALPFVRSRKVDDFSAGRLPIDNRSFHSVR